MQKAIIIDIDGTIADASHRLHYVTGSYKDYESFYSLTSLDSPIEIILDIILGMVWKHKAIFITGRRESCRQDTVNWLNANGFSWIDYELYMRQDHDFKEAELVKKAIYDFHVSGKYEVVMSFEDKPSCVELRKELWIPYVFDCNYQWDAF